MDEKHKRCDKVAFASEKYANEHMDRIRKKSDRDVVPVRAYKCNICGLWHLTSKSYFTQKQHDELVEKIVSLQHTIDKLESENKDLKKQKPDEKTAISKREKMQVMKSKTIESLKKSNADLKNTVKIMISARNQLIDKINKLEKNGAKTS